ncbi:tRNA (adenosine(37)-N6)-dimethylallyltransferase MiaA [Daejeonella lutea]|uniref:tRNA dimethylallyltransferase n=1 Tax=Daejeonella lutea TaxID=572036 RepID=A0A1T5A0C2_9SPHI|nr:tRNA (adenosine(37)-N6)-dimethylallyltransferase MiaA [Daejeonella lutea]SKB28103.1 tRNA dimethylallyltransferase [Daejeonella lutea]
MKAKTLVVIAGPTAIGKTGLAIKLAQHYNTEIISADSRQFYREMEIGTAKPSPEELKAAKHHFVNSLSITQNFNVGDFEREALARIDLLFNKNNVVILAGGSGLFIDAVIRGFDELPQSSKDIRDDLNKLLESKGISTLQEMLKEVDPVYFNEVDLNNPQRIIRALEVFKATSKPFSAFRSKIKKVRPFNIVLVGLNLQREILYNNINRRVDLMVNAGLIEEVESLIPYRTLNPLNTVGYSELFQYFDGNLSLEDAIEKIKQNTRRFAKRQLTWFSKSGEYHWFQPHEIEKIIRYLDSVLDDPEHEVQKS